MPYGFSNGGIFPSSPPITPPWEPQLKPGTLVWGQGPWIHGPDPLSNVIYIASQHHGFLMILPQSGTPRGDPQTLSYLAVG